MKDSSLLWPSENMDFWKIENPKLIVNVQWSHDLFTDYKNLAYQFYECGYKTFDNIVNYEYDNIINSDMSFFTGIFLLRHSIELGLKSLLCRVTSRKRDIGDVFKECCHNVSLLFQKYLATEKENFLIHDEKVWLTDYFTSLEQVDKKSDMFRFPFDDDFLQKYKNKFLDNVAITNNLLQAFALVKKCMEKGIIAEKDKFDNTLRPKFFIFASHGFGNCYLYQRLSDEDFYVKISGYSKVIDFLYENQQITAKTKLYPLIFMFRNTLELCLKRLFYSRVGNEISLKIFNSKRRSHLIKKDLWKNIKPVILKYSNDFSEDIDIVKFVEEQINEITRIDKKGNTFRYPTSYSLEYHFDKKELDLGNIYNYFKALINFFEGADFMLHEMARYEQEYMTYMVGNIEWD